MALSDACACTGACRRPPYTCGGGLDPSYYQGLIQAPDLGYYVPPLAPPQPIVIPTIWVNGKRRVRVKAISRRVP